VRKAPLGKATEGTFPITRTGRQALKSGRGRVRELFAESTEDESRTHFSLHREAQ
jgi:hypothetical protein